MSIDSIFSQMNNLKSGESTIQTNGNAGEKKGPPAEFWLNIGYETGDEKYPFVSLNQGIALDKIEDRPMSSNVAFSQLCQAQNKLRDDLLELAKKLAPGETQVIKAEGMPLMFQIRRVGGEVAEPEAGSNPLMKPLFAN